MVELGYSIVAVAERLGDTVEVAMSTYSHLYPNKMETLATDLEREAEGLNAAIHGTSSAELGDLIERLENAENVVKK